MDCVLVGCGIDCLLVEADCILSTFGLVNVLLDMTMNFKFEYLEKNSGIVPVRCL